MVGGMCSMTSIWPVFRAVTIASSLLKYFSPKPSMCGLGPHQFGLRWNSATSFLWYCVRMNGPPETSGLSVGSLEKVFRPLPFPVAYFFQVWAGRIDVVPRS